MDVKNIITAVSSVGFPIVAFFVCIWFLKYVYDRSLENERKNNESITSLANAVNENTKTLTVLAERLEK